MNTSTDLLLTGDAARRLDAHAAALPALALDAAGLSALELILDGALAPLTGFQLPCGDDGLAIAVDLDGVKAEPGDELALHDAEGVTLGVLTVSEIRPDPDTRRAAGIVQGIRLPERDLFPRHRRPIAELRSALEACARDDAVCITLRGVPDAGERDAITRTAGGSAVLLRVMDPGDADRAHHVKQRLDAASGLASSLNVARCVVCVCPDPFPRPGPDQDRADALYARNAGCSRDARFGSRHDPPTPAEGGGACIFFTGLSGSGKSTVARALHAHLVETTRGAVTLLDGDVVRRHLSRGLGFSRTDRDLNVRRIGFVASRVVMHGGTVICAPIAPYAATRAQVREMVEAHGRFIEVHVATPLAVCEARDRKGLYAKARAGAIKEFTGISDPYEAPDAPEVRVDTSEVAVKDAVVQVASRLQGER